MAYPFCFSLDLGPANTGLADLRAQLLDTAGDDVGGELSTGFVEVGANGKYLWLAADIPDDHRGGVKFYRAGLDNILGLGAINPEQAENVGEIVDAIDGQGITVNVSSVFVRGKLIQIIRGNDYHPDTGAPLDITIQGMPDLTGSTPRLLAKAAATAKLPAIDLYLEGEALSSTVVRFTPDRELTLALPAGIFVGDLEIELANGKFRSPLPRCRIEILDVAEPTVPDP